MTDVTTDTKLSNNTKETSSALTSKPDDGPEKEIALASLIAMSVVVGLVAGIGAIFFKYLIAFIYNLAFYGEFSLVYDPNAYGNPSSWGPFIILVPVIGGLIVVWLVQKFAPEAKGHGVPEVIYSIYYTNGDIRGIVAVVKSLASAISIGTGASVGREGPIIQIGASFGSSFGRKLGLVQSQKIVLLACGAGAGIAATFNAPLAGVLFAVEVLLPVLSPRSFLPVVAATATASYICRLVSGAGAAFYLPLWLQLPQTTAVDFAQIILAVGLGIAIGLASWLFVVLLAFMEDFFEDLPINPYFQNIIGMTAVGVLGYVFYIYSGHYHVYSVGYSTIQEVLANKPLIPLALMLLLFVGKLLATTISLGSGASGGIFSPCLFMGATLGGAVGIIGIWLFPDSGITIALFAIIGMSAMVGAATSACLTAIIIVFEMTRDYNLILPLVIAVAIAFGIRRALITDDIYTIKLRHRGTVIPTDRSTLMYLAQPAKSIMSERFIVLPKQTPLSDALVALEESKGLNTSIRSIIVSDGGDICGYINIYGINLHPEVSSDETLADVMKTDFIIGQNNDPLDKILVNGKRQRRSFAIIMKDNVGQSTKVDDAAGYIGRNQLSKAVMDYLYT